MSRSSDMGQSLGYQASVSRFVLYLLGCPTKGRPKDCIHPCPRYRHSGICEPCTQFVELECYCEATGIVKPCREWCEMEESQKELIKCCRVRCAKIMECGHQCPQICHPGKCADPKQCVENVIRYCDCERIERMFPCRGCGAKDQEVQCDNICAELLKSYKQAIAERKNNPFRHQDSAQDQNTLNSSSSGEELAIEAEELTFSQKSSAPENKNESESESGFNDDNKNSEDDRAETETAVDVMLPEPAEVPNGDRTASPAGARESPAFYTIRTPTLENPSDQPSSPVGYDDELSLSLDSVDSPKRAQNRVSRSSSRVSGYSEEDIPRQLDHEKIVKIMRSSTRRKKLIKCDQKEVIDEMQSSS